MVPSVGIRDRRELVVEMVIIGEREGTGLEEFGKFGIRV